MYYLGVLPSRQDAEQDREASASFVKRAEIAKMNGEPWEFIYMLVDAANQTNFATPLSAHRAHGLDDK